MQYTDSFKNLVDLGDDDMQASIYLRRKPDTTKYTKEELHELLRQAGVKHGVKEDVLQEIIDQEMYDRMLTVAEGKPAADGKDGEFELLFRTSLPSTPRIMDDGSVDYLNIDLFEKVEKDQLIARYHKPTGGSMGYTVRGKIMLPRKGKEKPAIRGRGFRISEDKSEYYADLSGKIEFVNGQILISDLYVVRGDLNSKIGNIDFSGDVQIMGAVRNGMQVSAGGSISINGVVEAADIKAGKNIVLRGGVLGNDKCTITAGKDIYGKFFENATVRAGGIVNCNYLLNSNVSGLKGVEVYGRKSVIMGGTTEALGYITACAIGNSSEVLTIIKAGVDDAYIKKLAILRRSMDQVNTEISIFEENLHKESDVHDKIVMGLCMKVDERLAISKQIEEIEGLLKHAQNAYVKVTGDVYPRVNIRIDTANTMMTQEIHNVTFRRKENMIAIYRN